MKTQQTNVTFQSDPLEPLLTIPDVSQLLKVSRRMVYHLIDQGLPTIKLGKSVRVHPGEFRRWLSRQIAA